MRFYQRSLDGKSWCQILKTGIGRTGNHFHRQTSSTASRQVRFIHSFCQRLYQAEQTGEGEEVDSKDHSPNEGSLKLTVALSAIAPNSVNVAACFHLTNWTWQAYKYSERLREGATGQTINQKRFPACLMTMKSLSLGLPAVGQWQQSNSGGIWTTRSQGPNSIKGSLAIVSNALSTATCRSYSNQRPTNKTHELGKGGSQQQYTQPASFTRPDQTSLTIAFSRSRSTSCV